MNISLKRYKKRRKNDSSKAICLIFDNLQLEDRGI